MLRFLLLFALRVGFLLQCLESGRGWYTTCKASPSVTWGAGAASAAGLDSPVFGRKIHPVFPRRKGDLQNSPLQEGPKDSAVSEPREIHPGENLPLRTSSSMPRHSVSRCLESFGKLLPSFPPLGSGLGGTLRGRGWSEEHFQLPWRLPLGE